MSADPTCLGCDGEPYSGIVLVITIREILNTQRKLTIVAYAVVSMSV